MPCSHKNTLYRPYYDNQLDFFIKSQSRKAQVATPDVWCVGWEASEEKKDMLKSFFFSNRTAFRLMLITFLFLFFSFIVLSHMLLLLNLPSPGWQHATPPLGCLSPDPGRPTAQIPVCCSNMKQPVEDRGALHGLKNRFKSESCSQTLG